LATDAHPPELCRSVVRCRELDRLERCRMTASS